MAIVALVLAVLLAGVSDAAAQAVSGTLLGTITDSESLPIPGASVRSRRRRPPQSASCASDCAWCSKYKGPRGLLPRGPFSIFRSIDLRSIDL